MGIVSDLLYQDNPKRRETVQALADSIEGDLNFIEKSTNDSIERINKYLTVKSEKVMSHGKTINQFLLEVQQAFEDLGRNAEEQYKVLPAKAKVDTATVENVRREVQGLNLEKMREAVPELEIAGWKQGKAMTTVEGLVTKQVMMHLEHTPWASVSHLGGLVSGALARTLVSVIFEAVSGAVERAELERRIRELTEAEQTIRDNRVAIVKSAQQLYAALVFRQIATGIAQPGNALSFRYVSLLTLYLLFQEH